MRSKKILAILSIISTTIPFALKNVEASEMNKIELKTVVKYATVNVQNSLNVREGRGTNYKIIGSLKRGEKVEVLDTLNGWSKIKYSGKIGYVSNQYLKQETNNTITNNVSKEGVVSVNDGLNVRAGAGTNFNIIGVLRNGEKISIIGESGEFYKIKYKNTNGYVSKKYIKNVTNNNANNNVNNNNSNSNNQIKNIGIVTATALNVREGTGTNFKVIGNLKKGSKVSIVEEKNGWYKIKHNNSYGYVSKEYITIENETIPSNPPTNNTVTKENGRVKGVSSSLNIREKSNTNSRVIGSLSNGEYVKILGEENNFYKIEKNNNIKGFASKDYIEKISESNNDTNNSTNDNIGTATVVNTIYDMSLNEYITLQQKRVPNYSYNYFEGYINPSKITNKFEFLRIDKFREISIDKLNTYLNNKGAGVLQGQGQAFYNTAKKFNLDPVYFVSQSIHETGFGKSTLAKGVKISEIANPNKEKYDSKGNLIGYEMIKLDKPVTVYNLYGIGAYDNTSHFPNRALILGTTYAYNKGWTSISKAIEGAGEFVSSGYINNSKYKQNTIYKMRYSQNIDNIWHQYATSPWYSRSIGEQMKELQHIYKGNNSYVLDIPKFKEGRLIPKNVDLKMEYVNENNEEVDPVKVKVN